jgi:hypothetical protein
MGHSYYTDEEEEDDKQDLKFQKNLLKHSLEELKHKSIVRSKISKLRKEREANPEEAKE